MDYADKLPPSPWYIFAPPPRYIFPPDAKGRADFRASIRDRLKVAESLDPGRRIDDLETVLTDLWRRAGEGC